MSGIVDSDTIFPVQGHKRGSGVMRASPGALVAPSCAGLDDGFHGHPGHQWRVIRARCPRPVSGPQVSGAPVIQLSPRPIPQDPPPSSEEPCLPGSTAEFCLSLSSTLPSLQVESLPRVNVLLCGRKEDGNIVGSDPPKYKLLRQRGTRNPLHGKIRSLQNV